MWPAARRPRAEVFLKRGTGLAWVLGLGLLFWASGCEPPAPPPSDPELRQELDIPDRVPIHRIDLSGTGVRTRVLPRLVIVQPGDLVQFVALDHRVHLVRFPQEELAPEALEFLRRMGQDRPPPLAERGARLVLSFQDAPVGRYPFRVEGNGPPVAGEIRVER